MGAAAQVEEGPKLHGARYLTRKWHDLADFLMHDLFQLDYDETLAFYRAIIPTLDSAGWALMGCNDRFFLLTAMCNRKDAINRWLFDRCREVELDPDGYLDLWAREHYKSTIITFAGIIQEILRDPEITIGLFSFNQSIARAFVGQIKMEFERNPLLNAVYHDVLWEKPKKQAPSWTNASICVRRKSNPKENTLEGWGLVSGQPTSKHYALMVYDDVVTRESVTNPDMILKVTTAWELSDNLGARGAGGGNRTWHIGTRYHFGDTYGHMLKLDLLKARIFPATDDGKITGRPVFMSQSVWDDKVRRQGTVLAAQMLQNPLAGAEQMFRPEWFRPYEVRPTALNVYIMGDPSLGKAGAKNKADNTAIIVLGMDGAGNLYLLDGFRHRMSMSERWANLLMLYRKWTKEKGVAGVFVGWERYGQQTDLEFFQLEMARVGVSFPIRELGWVREGGQSKKDRVSRLEPAMKGGRFFFPSVVSDPQAPLSEGAARALKEGRIEYPKGQGDVERIHAATWSVDEKKNTLVTRKQIHPTRRQKNAMEEGQAWRIAKPIHRLDGDRKPYDLTVALMSEMLFFPFAPRDDAVDACSRVYDMSPVPPVYSESPEGVKARARQLEYEDA